MCCRIVLLAAVACLVMAAPARADFVIFGGNGSPSVPGSATVALGDTADISFFIFDDPGDQLASFELELQISAVTVGQLQFAGNQPVAFLSDPNYVFAGNSEDAAPPPSPFWFPTFTTNYTNDTIAGGDSTANGGATQFPNTNTLDGSYLLATVAVYADSNLVDAGESFTIALVPPTGGNSDQTNFQDPNNSNPNGDPYTSSPVTVTVTPADMTTVPAPSALLLAGIGGLTSLLSYLRNRMKAPRPFRSDAQRV